jgi:hypothetical protein
MKFCFLAALVGLAIGVASPTFAQQTNTPDWDHDSNQRGFLDPAVGSWIIHVHLETFDSVDPASNLHLHYPSSSTISARFGKGVSPLVLVQTRHKELAMASGNGLDPECISLWTQNVSHQNHTA